MKDVMLDFETFGTGPNKIVCQVGACYFDNVTAEIGAEFKVNIDAASHEKLGGKFNASTIYWWLQQADAARLSLLNPEPLDIFIAMGQLNNFLAPATRVWSHATFDFVTLTETLNALGITPSVSYRAGMDLRTLIYLAGVKTSKVLREGVHHDALDDCKHQVKYCVASLNTIKTNKKLIAFINGLGD